MRRRADAIADRVLGRRSRQAAVDRGDARTRPTDRSSDLLVQLAHRLRDPDPRVTSSSPVARGARRGQRRDDGRSDVRPRAPAPGRDERHGPQHHHQHAADLGHRLGRGLRARQPGRRMLRENGNFAEMDFQTRDITARRSRSSRARSQLTELEVTRRAHRPPPRRAGATERTSASAIRATICSATATGPLNGRLRYRPPPSDWPRRARRGGRQRHLYRRHPPCRGADHRRNGGGARPFALGATLVLFALLAVVPALELATAILNRICRRAVQGSPFPPRLRRRRAERAPDAGRRPGAPDPDPRRQGTARALEVHYLANQQGDVPSLSSPTGRIPSPKSPMDDAPLLARAKGIAGSTAATPRAGRRALPPPPSPPTVERGAREVDGLGAEARQARRSSTGCSAEHRDTSFIADRTGRRRRSARRPLRRHARLRHPHAARHGPPAGRQDGPSAQPAALRSATARRVVEGYGIIQPRVTIALPMRLGRLVVPARVLRLARDGSLRRADLRPLPGPVRRGHVRRQGHLRRRRLRGGDRRAGRRKTRILSHDLFEGIFARAGLASDVEFVEEFPAPLRRLHASRLHRWVRGDWQLLPWIVGRRGEAGRRDRRSSAAGRCSTTSGAPCRRSPAAVALLGGLAPAAVGSAAWTLFVLAALHRPRRAAAPHRLFSASRPALAGGSISAAVGTTVSACARAVRLPRRHPRPSGRPDARRDRADALAARRHPAAPPRMDHGRTGEPRAAR